MTTRAKKILQLAVEHHSSTLKVTSNENIEPEVLTDEFLSETVIPEVAENHKCAPSPSLVENSNYEDVIQSDTDSEIEPFANSSEDDLDYEPSETLSDTNIELVSPEEQQDNDSDGSMDGDDDGLEDVWTSIRTAQNIDIVEHAVDCTINIRNQNSLTPLHVFRSV
ncbi:uncharacterized protein [Leptinotarsa decemlineata]|uniref:uncharacterized protein n=1 Tax=Leptinotarsa decemlineata TaxID=7539 RepID=UPI003D30A967